MGCTQRDAVFVFDEPSVGLHPLDVRTLVHVLDRFVDNGATVVVIEHDLDLIANADWVIDTGPGGGAAGVSSSPTAPPSRSPPTTTASRAPICAATWADDGDGACGTLVGRRRRRGAAMPRSERPLVRR